MQLILLGLKLFLSLLARGDVPTNAEYQLLPRAHGAVGADFNVKYRTVLAAVLRFEAIALWADTRNHIGNLLTWVLGFPIPDMELAGFLRGIAKHFGESLVGFIHLALLVEDNDTVTGLVDKDAPPGHFVCQLLLHLLALGDIPGYLKTGNYLSLSVSNRTGGILPVGNLP
ncbi:hypothetical protein ES708_24434 [subsurface metagenome]